MNANEFLDYYSILDNKKITCCLINGQSFTGIISSFFRLPELNNIYKWHLITENHTFFLGLGVFGEPIGHYIILNQLDYLIVTDNTHLERKIKLYEK